MEHPLKRPSVKTHPRPVQRTGIAVWLLIIGLLGSGCRQSPPVDSPAENPPEAGKVKFLMEQQWLIRMKLALVKEQSVARQITATGRVTAVPDRRATLSAPVEGLVRTSAGLPRIGQNVAKGQLLAVLEESPTAADRAQISAANAQVGIENARLEAERRRLAQSVADTRARLTLARNDFERAQKLHADGILARNEFEAAQTRLESAEADAAAARDQLAALGVAGAIRPALTQTRVEIRAPLSGTVVAVHKTPGEHLNQGDALLEIVNLDQVWVEAPVFEKDLARLATGKRGVFTTVADSKTEFVGTLVTIGKVIDERTRAATVVFTLPNRGGDLRIGMQANLRLDAGEAVRAALIPREAVLDHEGKKIVYVLVSGEEFERRVVTLGDEYGDTVAVLSGLRAGERVVTQGAYQLKLQELRPASAGAHTHET
jgi:membrane fusion protein, heavy metal efflux system